MIYVDEPQIYVTPLRYKNWSHLWTTGDIEELHKLAQKIGLKREWFQDKPGNQHYDCVPSKRTLAIKLGATPVSLIDWYRDRRARGVLNWNKFEPEKFEEGANATLNSYKASS